MQPTFAPVENNDIQYRLANAITDLFRVDDITVDWPQKDHIRFRGAFLQDIPDVFDDLRLRFEALGFTPSVRKEDEHIILIALPGLFRAEPKEGQWRTSGLLFLATIVSTLFVGASAEPAYQSIRDIWMGWPMSLSILLILGAHELGHYFAARYHGVETSPPYFIPIPTIIGTMGAFITLKEPMKNRRVLFDIGIAGPLAGLIFAIPILFIGLANSPVEIINPSLGSMREGNSIFYYLAKYMVSGHFLPDGLLDVRLNQVAWAAWGGLLVTGMNLIPVGQLDGGHVLYALLGRRAKNAYWPVLIGLAAISVITRSYTWVFWIGMLLFYGKKHAEPLDDVTELGAYRRALAIFALVIFVLLFVPIPLTPFTS